MEPSDRELLAAEGYQIDRIEPERAAAILARLRRRTAAGIALETEANLGGGWQVRLTRYLEKAVLDELHAIQEVHGLRSTGIASQWAVDLAVLRVLEKIVPAAGGSKGLQEVIGVQEVATAQILARLTELG